MIKTELMERLADLKGALRLIEYDLAENGVNQNALRDFQAVVEGARTSVWTVLSAVNSADYHAFVTDFRLRRTTEVLESILEDVEAGHLAADTPGLTDLRDGLENLCAGLPNHITASPETT